MTADPLFRRLNPPSNTGWVKVTPKEWAQHLRKMRQEVCERIDLAAVFAGEMSS